MQENRLAYLLQQYAENTATKQQVEEMFRLLDESTDAPELMAKIMADRIQSPVKQISFTRKWLPYAAAILIIMTGAIVYKYSNIKPYNPTQTIAVNNIIVPGFSKAILTLSSGEKIELNSDASETVNDGDLAIKNTNGQLIYGSLPIPSNGGVAPGAGMSHRNNSGPGAGVGSGETLFNTMSTPAGGQYELTLPDGTHVWLNAASSITYPTVFTGTARKVSITGEAYFKVSANKSKPFRVKYNNKEIEVLGTEFNVNTYTDEDAPKTTLISGAVKIDNIILRPGEQYINGKIIKADISMAAAWKNGYFKFSSTPLPEVLRQLSRWYDINITYPPNKIPSIKFDGRMGRNLQLSQVLRGLEQMGVHFKMEGRNLIVL